jgi:WD40 repeat protein
VKNYIDCKNVTIIEEIIKNVKTSSMFTEIEHLIKEMIENIGIIRKNRGTNSSDVKDQKRIIENEIHVLRTKINNHLDRLQEHLMKKLTEAETHVTEETCELLVSLDEKQKELIEYQTNIVNIKKYASDLQTYLAVKQIEKDVETQDKRIRAMINSDRLNQTKLSYKIDSGLGNITTNIQTFGKVVVESKPCEMNLVRKKDKQAQMMVADLSPPISVDNIQLKLKQKINIKGKTIRGCSFLSDGRMVFSCSRTNTVSIINKEGVELFQIGKYKTGSNTYNTVFIKDNNSVAVSSGGGVNRCIAIIDRESQKVMTTISMDTYIYGMAVRGRTIYYCAGSKGLKMLNLNDKSKSNVINSNMTGVDYELHLETNFTMQTITHIP